MGMSEGRRESVRGVEEGSWNVRRRELESGKRERMVAVVSTWPCESGRWWWFKGEGKKVSKEREKVDENRERGKGERGTSSELNK